MFDYFKGVISDKRKTSKGTFITIDVRLILTVQKLMRVKYKRSMCY